MKAPIYRDTQVLCAVLLEATDGGHGFAPLRHALTGGALRVQAAVVQALAGHDRRARVDEADAELSVLHARLALAHYLGVLDDDAFTGLVACAQRIGRQLGGWSRSLAREVA